ncbi:MAG: lysophospholipid acyltransferase family protein [Gemmatimonadota bacterium]|nr:lysophospholipid acyltransferase family protein [Gemmatimonadota bacterium]MDH3424907.1 lysophospholipid acyltransferase family protein [Gemmatimonadota bacterium]
MHEPTSSSNGRVTGPSARHRLEYAGFRFLRALIRVLPSSAAEGLGAALGWLVGTVFRVRRADVDEHLAFVFSDRAKAWRARVARRSYMHFGREGVVLFMMGRWSKERIAECATIVGFEEVRRAVEEEGGVVVLTGHLGNWEVAGAALAARGIPLDVVGKGMANRRFEADLFEVRERLGMRVIEMSDAPQGVLRSLGRGRVTAMVADQNMHRHGIFLPFFGRAAATARGPALFALRTGAPVFVGFATRQPGRRARYAVEIERLWYEISGNVEADVLSLMLAYHASLERAIRAAPEQYFWQHRRWKTRPPEEQPSQP